MFLNNNSKLLFKYLDSTLQKLYLSIAFEEAVKLLITTFLY